MAKAATVRELRDSGYQTTSVKQELRDNLIGRLKRGEPIFPGIVGYEESVLPQIENAILSGQDIVFLGERGQAKTRMARLLVGLLDDEMPAPARLYLPDELTIPYGLLQRTNRGIFAINELPDLAERIQVGLLNIMEERDVQIRGYKVRLPLDLYVVASANPEDYTNRGRIITPLKDRFGSQIRTHYPKRLEHEIAIMEAELTRFPADGFQTVTPGYMKEIVAELTQLARKAPEISQRSGVSVRVSICNYENLVSSALKRAIRLGEQAAAPRVSDLGAVLASTSGKIELETVGEGGEDKVLGKLVQRAVLNVFGRCFRAGELDEVVGAFQGGLAITVSDTMASAEYVKQVGQLQPLQAAVKKLGAADPASAASAVEFILEGLHLSRKLNKDVQAGRARYRGSAGSAPSGRD